MESIEALIKVTLTLLVLYTTLLSHMYDAFATIYNADVVLDFPKISMADVTEEGTRGLLMILLCRLGPDSSNISNSSSDRSCGEKRSLSVCVVTTREDCVSFAETLIYLVK